MRLRILGPLSVWDGGRWVTVQAGKQLALLAILCLHRGQALDRQHLVDMLWNGRPPRSADRVLSHYVWRLRQLMAADGCELRAVPNGYLLAVDAADIDSERFARLLDEGREAAGRGDTERAVGALGAALTLWCGPALADARMLPVIEAAAGHLDESRVAAREHLAELHLRLGRYAEALAALEELTTTEPYRERPWRLLMLALHRAGRRPHALAAYQRLWQIWTDDLGIEPGRDMRELHRQMLDDDPSLTDLSGPPAPVRAGRPTRLPEPVAAQLPPTLADFTGRADQTDTLTAALAPSVGTGLRGVMVYGPGGMGKTALAVRVGHLLRPAYPDGQLFVDLRGIGGPPSDPARVLAQFLRALGLPSSALTDGLDERARQFRSMLAERRVLVVLDNAASEAQVRPLLPPPSGAVVVTSRRPLVGLEGLPGLRLGVLSADDAADLLGRLAGGGRVTAEPGAASRIVELCGGLPLAVRTAGARLAAKPHWPLDRFAARLADEHRRLDELRAGDLEVRASLALSYDSLDPAERAGLGVAALAPAVGFPAWLIAAGCRIGEADAEDLAEQLVDAQLLDAAEVVGAGQSRYRVHDLTRIYVLERLADVDGAAWCAEVVARCLHVGTALTVLAVECAGDRVRGFDQDPREALDTRHAPTARLIERDAYAWYTHTRGLLVGAVDLAAERGFPAQAWRLAHAQAMFFEARAAWDDWGHTHRVARRAAAAAGLREGEAAMLSGLGRLELDRARFAEGMVLLRSAEQLCRGLGIKPLLGLTLQRLGQGSNHIGRYDEGDRYAREGLAIAESLGDRVVQVDAMRSLGWSQHVLGRTDVAAKTFQRARRVLAAGHTRHQEPWLLSDLARVHRDGDRLDTAIACFEEALAAAESLEDRRAMVHVMYALGDARRQAGEPKAAIALLERALALSRELFDDHAESLTLRRLGLTYTDLGRYDEARACLTSALRMARSGGRSQAVAMILLDLGTAHARAGDHGDATAALEESAALFGGSGLAEHQHRAEVELRRLTGG
jgi:DNA-binding SARP family transcriptional activator